MTAVTKVQATAALKKVEQLLSDTDREPLINNTVALRDFTRVAYAESHGAFDRHLGAGILYYALSQLVRSQVSVCIGSGGGFVPSLMRRAQLDAGINPSATFLIDANLPDLSFGSPLHAGGWMTEENKFLKRESDIVVLPMLSVDAAQLLAASCLRIDHLHIDGDHSKSGVIADFENYLPLLSECAVVSLHDVRMIGVQEALCEIRRRHPEMQLLTFPEVGAGTGIMRRVPQVLPSRRGQTLSDPDRKITVRSGLYEEAVGTSQTRAKFERWSYLATPAYQMRYRLAAEWIDGAGATVVEIGGFPNSVTGYLSRARNVHLIEPYVTDEFVAKVKADARERKLNLFFHLAGVAEAGLNVDGLRPFNLVMLGLDISSTCKTSEEREASLAGLLRMIGSAERVALEVPSYKRSLITVEYIMKIMSPRVLLDVTMDLSNDPVGASFHVRDNRAVRRLLIIERDKPIDFARPDINALVRNGAEELMSTCKQGYAPVESRWPIGEPVRFVVGGRLRAFPAPPMVRLGSPSHLDDGGRIAPCVDPGK